VERNKSKKIANGKVLRNVKVSLFTTCMCRKSNASCLVSISCWF